MLDPTASSMGWSADILEGSPFGDALLSSAPGFTIAFWVTYGLLAILILTLVLLPPVRRFYLPGKQGSTV